MTQRKIRDVGSFWYLGGDATKVEIMTDFAEKSLVIIRETAKHSKFDVNQVVMIPHRILYPYRKGEKNG